MADVPKTNSQLPSSTVPMAGLGSWISGVGSWEFVLVSAPGAGTAWRRGTSSRLLLHELLARRLHLGDEFLVAGRVDIGVLLRIGLQLLVLAGQIEEPAVRAEEHVARHLLQPGNRVRPLFGGLRILLVVDDACIVRQTRADDDDVICTAAVANGERPGGGAECVAGR